MFVVQKFASISLAIGIMIAGLIAFQPEAKAFEAPENWRGGLQTYGWDHSPYSRNNPYDLVCTSDHYKTKTCRLPRGTNGQIRLVKQISQASCIRGQSWGAGERRVWVSDGCRAVFRLSNGGGNGEPYPHARKKQLSCGSAHGRYHTCHLRDARRRHVRIIRQVSNSPCVRGDTWGVKANKIWVDDGCRGVFHFNGRRPHYWSPSE